MQTYKQPVKELSRELIWNHAVESLTTRRDENRILNPSYMDSLWQYCQQLLKGELNYEEFVKWKEYSDICYGTKKPEELKVAFFCGNEPENDVKHLMRLGVRIENCYAFECDNKSFKEAVTSLQKSYPLLKIYRGKIEDYAELQNTKFDIIYLDFTGSLIKEYKTVVKILDLNALADMSILAVNTSYPDKTDENISFLTNFFYNDTFFEYSVIDGIDKERPEGDTWFYRVESCDCVGINQKQLKSYIDEHFEKAYSAFQSAFLLDYANRHKASYEVFKKKPLSTRIIKKEILDDLKVFFDTYHATLLQESLENGIPLPSSQYECDSFMNTKEKGAFLSRTDSMKLTEVLIETPYHHWKLEDSFCENSKSEEVGSDIDEENTSIDFKAILTQEVYDVVNNLGNWFYQKYSFCDLPMEHLWLELLLFQFGHPYHTNVGNHKRYKYTAKIRPMCIDILSLDKCRALYDWIPMLEYFIHDMSNNDRQLITRMGMDAIDKQLLHIVEEIYYGGALVGINEREWSKNKVLPNRIDLNDFKSINEPNNINDVSIS